MQKCTTLAVAFLVFSSVFASSQEKPKKPETPHLAFVTEYVRELSELENLRRKGAEELKRDPEATFTIAIHSGTLFQLELRSQIAILKDMRLDPPFDELIPILTKSHEQRVALWKRMVEISSQFLAGPKPGVDCDKLLAESPVIRAGLDYIDKTLLEVSPVAATTLLDMRPDSKNHVSHLTITKEERSNLIDQIEGGFGPSLDEEDQNYMVGTARLLRDFLRNHKASDEPWE
ncbi:MAG TPA: hypothetical protein VJP02_13120 [Candidatus Sulfotelmatobacter sp.]|nr:hypothetical protein [Candidatus Sulfotelmatobacter sp.]